MSYQSCHRHLGHLTHEMDIARKLLLKHGSPCADAVKEMHRSVDMPISECSSMLRCMWRDMRLEQLEAENDKLRELLIDVSEEVPWSFMDTTKYYMPLRADKLRKLLCRMRELGIKV